MVEAYFAYLRFAAAFAKSCFARNLTIRLEQFRRQVDRFGNHFVSLVMILNTHLSHSMWIKSNQSILTRQHDDQKRCDWTKEK